MSQKVNTQKIVRRTVKENTDKLGIQIMKNILAMPFLKRLRVALIIIFKRPI
jgi:hypothetical protein